MKSTSLVRPVSSPYVVVRHQKGTLASHLNLTVVEIKAAKQAARDATRSLIKKTSEVAAAANASLREALTAALHTKACVEKAEEQLRRLHAVSLGMQVEEEEEEQDDGEDEEDEVQEEGEGGAGHHEPPTDRRCLAMPVPHPPTAP
eukprot:jgi/Tetstr1/463351/TSEL_008274.t1